MKNIKLVYSYDGSDFYGFQRQPKTRTVQGELEKVLKIIFKEKIDMISSGRTDRGVHAKKQVSNFITSGTVPIEKIKKILNEMLPKDIVINDVEEVNLEFNSRFSAIDRSYEYYITNEKTPFKSRYATYVSEKLDVEKLNSILKPLIGKHDFSNFRLADCGSKNPVREMYEGYFEEVDKDMIKLYIRGNAFLKSQIRIIVGTILAVYFKKKPENLLKNMLENPEINFPKILAEPNGLFLSDIEYEV